MYQVNGYIEFGMFGGMPRLTDPQQIVDMGMYRLLDGAGAASALLEQIVTGPVVDCFSWTLFPGEPLDQAAERLEYFATTVIPAVRAGLSSASP